MTLEISAPLTFCFHAFIACTLCIEFLVVVFTVNSQELFEVVATDFPSSSSSSLLHSINPLAGQKKPQDVEIVQYK
jgi:hypothetical protein